jgi:hypothetical protein
VLEGGVISLFHMVLWFELIYIVNTCIYLQKINKMNFVMSKCVINEVEVLFSLRG